MCALAEIKKFGEIGNKPLSTCGLSGVQGIKQIASSFLELQVLSLTENVNILESKSEELDAMLALKDSRIAELETVLSGGKFLKEKSAFTIGLSEENFEEVKSELESLFRQKIEAEVEYLAIVKIKQNLKAASAFMSLGKHETLSGNQVLVPNKLGEAGDSDPMLKNQADRLEKYCGDILGAEETFMIQKRVCKLTFCLLLQFTLLILVFWLLVSQLLPNSRLFVPT